MGWRRLVARGIEIVAERRAERLLVAGGDLDLFDDRRPIVSGRQQLGQRGELGVDFLVDQSGRSGQRPRLRLIEPRLFLVGLDRLKLGFGGFDRGDQLGKTDMELGELAFAAALGLVLGQLLFKLGGLGGKLGGATLKLHLLAIKPAALGAGLGQRGGRLAQSLFG